MSATLFVDTNVLLHYKRFDQIDWVSLAQTSQVLLVLPPVVFRELNKHKDLHTSHKIRKRAQSVLVVLRDILKVSSKAAVRPNVEIEASTHEPMIDFAVNQLSREQQDDVLLASLLEYAVNNPGSDCRLVTADIGFELKARSHHILVVQPPDGLKLPEEEDPNEKRIRELEAQVRELKYQVPELRLHFKDGTGVARFSLPKQIEVSPAQVESQLEQIRSRYPQLEVSSNPPTPKQPRSVREYLALQQSIASVWGDRRLAPEEIERYNNQLEEFYQNYRRYLLELPNYQNRDLRTIRLDIFIRNEGTSPAEEIFVKLHLPDGFQVFSGERIPQLPRPPQAPTAPKSPAEQLQERMSAVTSMSIYPRLVRDAPRPQLLGNVSPATIRRSNSYDVEFSVRKLNHGFSEPVSPLYVCFESHETASPFKVDYRIHAANVPKPVEGALHVVVEKETAKAS